MNTSSPIALVTGASRGIGRGIALRLAREKMHVIVHYKDKEGAAREVVQTIEAEGGTASLLRADIGSLPAVQAAAAQIERLDVLVNNAGWGVLAPLGAVTEADYDAVFNLNVKGLYFLTQELAPRLRDGGRIVNISSGITRSSGAHGAVYAASKSAVEAFTRAWAAELGPRGITVNTVLPGMTETDLLQEVVPREVQEQAVASVPLGRLGQPNDIAEVVAWLCTPAAGWITGNALVANGGA